MPKEVEKYYPIVLSLLLTGILIASRSAFISSSIIMMELAKNAITVCSTLLGFFLTILTLINSINTRRMHFVKSTPLYEVVFGWLKHAIIFNLITLLASLIITFIDGKKINSDALMIIGYAYVFLFIFTILLSTRFTLTFISLMTEKKDTAEK